MRRVYATAFALLIVCQPGKTKEGATPLVRKANYWSSMADESLPMELYLSETGSAELWLRCNRNAPDRRALGRFRHAFPPSEAVAVFGKVDAKPFAAISNPKDVIPGEVIRKIALESADGKQSFRFAVESSPPAAAFIEAEGPFLALADKLADFPDAALSFRLDRGLPEKAGRGKEASLILTLMNAGHVPLRIDLPAGWRASGTEMLLTGLRTDIPLEKMRKDHSGRIAPGSGAVKTDPAFPEGGTNAILAPGKSVSLSIRLVFDWQPGPYEAKLSYAFRLSEAPVRAAAHTGTDKGLDNGLEKDLGRFEWISPGMRLILN